MTKFLLLLPILFGSLLAGAQSVDPCTGAKVDGPPTITPIPLPMTCVKEQGRGWDFNLQGALAWRYCLDPETKRYTAQIAAVTRQELFDTPGLARDLFLAGPKADDATISRLGAMYVPLLGKFTDKEHAAVWCPYRGQIAAEAPPPPVIHAWVTSGTTTYRFTGKSLAEVVGYVNLGMPCDGSAKPFALGQATYLPLKGGPTTTVARCKRN